MSELSYKSSRNINNYGFTLIEMLTTMSIIALLSTVVLIAINPLNIILTARDSTRVGSVDTINKAIQSYLVNHENDLCNHVDTCPSDFELTGTDSISLLLLQNKYLNAIPQPPQDPTNPEFCDYHLFLYKDLEEQDDYKLRWCFESWTKDDVDRISDSNYQCEWNEAEQIAVCFTNRTYKIPPLK